MQPYPAPNSVIVMDNCRIHKDPEIIELIESRYVKFRYVTHTKSDHISRGMKVEFLPAYSPDFNPIELAFSAIKSYIRRNFRDFARSNSTGTNVEDDRDVYFMLYEAVFSVSAKDALAFFHHSGYC